MTSINDLIFEREPFGFYPTKAHADDAGWDLYVPDREQEGLIGAPNQHVVIDLDVRVLIPHGYVGLVMGRSSSAAKGLNIITGVIDNGYTGVLKLAFFSLKNYGIKPKDRIAQLLIVKLFDGASLCGSVKNIKTIRGNNGFGSSGR